MAGDPAAAAEQYRASLGADAPPGGETEALRAAAWKAIGPLPLDPTPLLGQPQAIAATTREMPLVASAGPISVHAREAALGAEVLAAAQHAAEEIARWAGPDALKVAVAIVVLDSRGQFREVTGQAPGVDGVTMGHRPGSTGDWLIYSFVGAHGLAARVIPHEMTHALVGAAIGRGGLPLWLNEGLAMSSEPDAGAGHVQGYRRAFAAGTALPIEELVRLRGYPSDYNQIDSYYAGAAALTTFLIQAADREKLLALGRRAAANGMDAAMREGYAGFGSLDEVLVAFQGWLRSP